jgi:putative MATE family efflux protein
MQVFAEPVIRLMGAGVALDLSVTYARISFGGIIFMFFTHLAVSILRSEGDAKRPMYVMLAGSALNIILDPIFIYSLDLGVAGAAWATIVSMFLGSLVIFYWLFIEKKTYISFRFKGFRMDRKILADISRVGFPASISHMSMALMGFLITIIIASIGGPDGVAVYSTGWRVVSLATLPMIGVGSAVTSVTGAAFGARDYKKIAIAYWYALKIGVLIEILLAILVFVFAAQITGAFTWSKESARIIDDLILFLRVVSIFFPSVAFGMLTASMFQGTGKGLYALGLTLIRTLVFTVPFAWLFGIFLDKGLLGVWIGMGVSGFAYIPIALVWAAWYLRRLNKDGGIDLPFDTGARAS